MRYDLGVWPTPRPRDDVEAGELFDQLSQLMDRDQVQVPTALLATFSRHLLSAWPGLDVWATADGIRVGVSVDADVDAEKVSAVVAAVAGMARSYGLVCYDPQRASRIA